MVPDDDASITPVPSPRSSARLRSEFAAASSPHDWLRTEVARFLFPDRSIDDAYAGALAHLDVAAENLDALSNAQFSPGELVGFELRIGVEGNLRRAILRALPSPAALLLLCCDRAEPGEEVVVRHIIAHRDIVEMRTVWPFSMDVAVSMVSPSADEIPTTQPPRRRFTKRPRRT